MKPTHTILTALLLAPLLAPLAAQAQQTSLPASAVTTAKPADDLAKIVAASGIVNQLRLDLQRPIDPRLEKLETGDISKHRLFRGKTHLVRNAGEVSRLSGKLAPGDQLMLAADGAWKDARFTFQGEGTEAAPILIRPEVEGAVVFSGAAGVTFHGSHLIITGLEFRAVIPTGNGAVVFRLGNGRAQPAERCIVNRIKVEDCNSPDAADWPKQKVWYLTADFGADNTVANSTFAGLRHLGQMIGAAELPGEGLQRLHILNNQFSNRPYLDNQNGYEVLQIGWSAMRARPSGSLIQGNTFERCDGENELITLKASDIVVRGNRFLACQGVLCLRTARRVLVQNNIFDGQGRENTGGVRLQGDGHVVVGNTFRDLKKPRDYYTWPISLMAADLETYGETDQLSGYGRTHDILITRNRFEHYDKRIAAGIYASKTYPLLPKNIVVRENVFAGMGEGSAFDFISPDPSGELPKELHESSNTFEP
jgi:poly(beta-D-mannuronate) lyase